MRLCARLATLISCMASHNHCVHPKPARMNHKPNTANRCCDPAQPPPPVPDAKPVPSDHWPWPNPKHAPYDRRCPYTALCPPPGRTAPNCCDPRRHACTAVAGADAICPYNRGYDRPASDLECLRPDARTHRCSLRATSCVCTIAVCADCRCRRHCCCP